jgi:large subunit ribosomal protein L20
LSAFCVLSNNTGNKDEDMTRVKRGNVARKRRKKILKLAKGFRGSHSRLFRTANQQVMKALRNAYRDRRKRKRDFRRLWIARINAAARLHGMSYSQLIGNLKKADVMLNRKMLAQLAVLDPDGFASVLAVAAQAGKA